MNKLLTPYKDGIYKALFYAHCLELENGDKLKTDIGIRCPRNACGGWKTYKIEGNTFKEIDNFSNKMIDLSNFNYDSCVLYEDDSKYLLRNVDRFLKDRKGTCYDFVNAQYFLNNKQGDCYFMFNQNGGRTHTVYVKDNIWYEYAWKDLQGKHKINKISDILEIYAKESGFNIKDCHICKYIPNNKEITRQEFCEWMWSLSDDVYDENIKNFSEKLSDVKSKTKLPEGTFTNKASTIKKILVEHSKNKNDCIKKINFYINRAGKNLENKTEVMKAKRMIENMIEFSDLTERLQRINERHNFAKQLGTLYRYVNFDQAKKDIDEGYINCGYSSYKG